MSPPTKDPEKAKEVVKKSKAKLFCGSMQIYLRVDEPEYNSALAQAAADLGISRQQYLKSAAIEKLKKDGYLNDEAP